MQVGNSAGKWKCRAPAISLGARGARNSVYKRLKLLFLLSPRIISNKMSAPSRCNILLWCQFFSLHRGARPPPPRILYLLLLRGKNEFLPQSWSATHITWSCQLCVDVERDGKNNERERERREHHWERWLKTDRMTSANIKLNLSPASFVPLNSLLPWQLISKSAKFTLCHKIYLGTFGKKHNWDFCTLILLQNYNSVKSCRPKKWQKTKIMPKRHQHQSELYLILRCNFSRRLISRCAPSCNAASDSIGWKITTFHILKRPSALRLRFLRWHCERSETYFPEWYIWWKRRRGWLMASRKSRWAPLDRQCNQRGRRTSKAAVCIIALNTLAAKFPA